MARNPRTIRAERLGLRDLRPGSDRSLTHTTLTYREFKDPTRMLRDRTENLHQALRAALNLGTAPLDVDEDSKKVYQLTDNGPVHIATYATEKIVFKRSPECATTELF